MGSASRPSSCGPFSVCYPLPMNLAYLHPMFVHFPVALSLVGTGLLGWGTLRRQPPTVRAGLVVLCLAAVLSVPTYITGEVARSVMEDQAQFMRAPALLDRHEDLGLYSMAALIALGILSGIALIKREYEGQSLWTIAVLALAVAVLVAVTAFYGGRLVFEEGIGVSRAATAGRR